MGKRAGRTPASNSAKKAKSEDDWVGRMMKALQQLNRLFHVETCF